LDMALSGSGLLKKPRALKKFPTAVCGAHAVEKKVE
jgi:hypothetical protein